MGIALGAIALVLLAAGFIELLLLTAKILHLQHALGMDTQTSHNYASASGVDPMIVAALGFSGFILGLWHHLNCHTDGCPKIGRHRVAGGKFKICTGCLRRVDPAHDVPHTIAHIREHHERAE